MTEESAFLRAVCGNPHDILPRLIMSDWWEENGQTERSEFCRVQCELDALHRSGPCPTCGRLYGERHEPDCRWNDRSCLELQLLAAHGHDWSKPVGEALGLKWSSYSWGGDMAGQCLWEFRRGFVESITCPARTFLEHCHDVRNACPLREATLTGIVDPDWFRGFPMIHGRAEGEGVRLCQGEAELGIIPLVWESYATSGRLRSEWGRKLFLDLLHAEFRGVSFRLAGTVTVRDVHVRGGSVFLVREPRAFITGQS